MSDASLVRRVETLENDVQSLQKLPVQVQALTRRVGHVERQILQLRGEMLDEFSAIRREMATKDDLAAIRREMATKEELSAVRREMATKDELASGLTALREELRGDIAGTARELAGAIGDLATGQSRILMLVEDIQARLRIRQEGAP